MGPGGRKDEKNITFRFSFRGHIALSAFMHAKKNMYVGKGRIRRSECVGRRSKNNNRFLRFSWETFKKTYVDNVLSLDVGYGHMQDA